MTRLLYYAYPFRLHFQFYFANYCQLIILHRVFSRLRHLFLCRDLLYRSIVDLLVAAVNCQVGPAIEVRFECLYHL